MDDNATHAQTKQPYERPSLVREGALADVTRGGLGAATDVGNLGSAA